MYHVVADLFYGVRRCWVRCIRYMRGSSSRHGTFIPVHLPKRLYFQLRAIAAQRQHCSPKAIPPSTVAATLADLIELGLYHASFPHPTVAPSPEPPIPAPIPYQISQDLAHLWAETAALQQRLEHLETLADNNEPSPRQSMSGRADYSAINGHIDMRLKPITPHIQRLEAQIQEVRHHLNHPAPAANPHSQQVDAQFQTMTTQIHHLQVGMEQMTEQMTAQRTDWQQTFWATQQQLQGLAQAVERLSQKMAQLTQSTLTQIQSIPPSYPTVSTAPGNSRARPPATQFPDGSFSTIEAEILHTSTLADPDWGRSPSPMLDLDGITQLELCQRFGLSHHTLVRDSQNAGFSSVQAYLEAKTGFQSRQVGRWWRYYSGTPNL